MTLLLNVWDLESAGLSQIFGRDDEIPRLSGSQALVNLNRLEMHGMTPPLSLIESEAFFWNEKN